MIDVFQVGGTQSSASWLQNGHNRETHFSEKLHKLHKIDVVPGKEHAVTGYRSFSFVNGAVLLRSR